ncbi:MAG TPA: epimerase, partial [Chloroflexi bacterium]|nr:epimerase [Chloroflexota bacterium]
GGAGFIGSHTVDLLLSRGYNVRVLDSLVSPVHLDNIKPDYLSKDVEFVLGDVRDKAVWESALINIDAVFHLAAYQDYLPDFSKFFHVNTVGTANLYEVIVEHNLSIGKIIVASSQAIYGE